MNVCNAQRDIQIYPFCSDQYDSDDSYNPNYDAGEDCKTNPEYHHNEVECHKADFFDNSIVKKLNEDPNLKGKNVKYCCKDHGFVYNHACEVLSIIVKEREYL